MSIRHPFSVSVSMLCLSLRRFSFSFGNQKARRDFGNRANEHLGWRCQKHPCTKMILRLLGNTRSGRPGNEVRCSRYRYPIPWTSRRTRISTFVSLERISAILALLAVLLRVSIASGEVGYRRPSGSDGSGRSNCPAPWASSNRLIAYRPSQLLVSFDVFESASSLADSSSDRVTLTRGDFLVARLDRFMMWVPHGAAPCGRL